MFEKQGKYYADWRDRTGVRKRKSFSTARAALRFESEQKDTAHSKPTAQRLHSPKYSAPASKSRAAHAPKIPTSRKQSSPMSAPSHRKH
jgi:hypothetical protein